MRTRIVILPTPISFLGPFFYILFGGGGLVDKSGPFLYLFKRKKEKGR
jgi:hypothetical protein